MFTNLQQLITSMPDEQKCREYLEQQIWNGKPICPFCGCDRSYKLSGGRLYKCASNKCYKKYTITVGTVFECSNVPLSKWFIAVYMATAHKKGISSIQLGKNIGVTQRTAWFMLHRIREMMRTKSIMKLDNIVEIDEAFVGGIVSNMHKAKRAALRTGNNGAIQNKTMVVGMVERGGELKLIAMGKETGRHVVQPIVLQNVDKDAVLITDASANYEGLHKTFAGHEVINHTTEEYVRDGVIHTNTIEGAFSMLKRSIIGCYHQVTPKHLSRYCDETMFRYNLRKMNDAHRFTLSLQNLAGRLKYKDLVKKEKFLVEHIESPIVLNPLTVGRPVYQISKDGEVLNRFESLTIAQNVLGINKRHISNVLRGKKKHAGGFVWKYA